MATICADLVNTLYLPAGPRDEIAAPQKLMAWLDTCADGPAVIPYVAKCAPSISTCQFGVLPLKENAAKMLKECAKLFGRKDSNLILAWLKAWGRFPFLVTGPLFKDERNEQLFILKNACPWRVYQVQKTDDDFINKMVAQHSYTIASGLILLLACVHAKRIHDGAHVFEAIAKWNAATFTWRIHLRRDINLLMFHPPVLADFPHLYGVYGSQLPLDMRAIPDGIWSDNYDCLIVSGASAIIYRLSRKEWLKLRPKRLGDWYGWLKRCVEIFCIDELDDVLVRVWRNVSSAVFCREILPACFDLYANDDDVSKVKVRRIWRAGKDWWVGDWHVWMKKYLSGPRMRALPPVGFWRDAAEAKAGTGVRAKSIEFDREMHALLRPFAYDEKHGALAAQTLRAIFDAPKLKWLQCLNALRADHWLASQCILEHVKKQGFMWTAA